MLHRNGAGQASSKRRPPNFLPGTAIAADVVLIRGCGMTDAEFVQKNLQAYARGQIPELPTELTEGVFWEFSAQHENASLEVTGDDVAKVFEQFLEKERSVAQLVDWWCLVRYGLFPSSLRKAPWTKGSSSNSKSRRPTPPGVVPVKIVWDPRCADEIAEALSLIEDFEDEGAEPTRHEAEPILQGLRECARRGARWPLK